MESKTKIKSNEKPKTKKQIEADHPIIRPEDCPGAVIDWVVARDEKRDTVLQERDKELVRLIAETIDKLFEKHFKRYVTMIFTNRILVVVLAVFLTGLWGVVVYHLYK